MGLSIIYKQKLKTFGGLFVLVSGLYYLVFSLPKQKEEMLSQIEKIETVQTEIETLVDDPEPITCELLQNVINQTQALSNLHLTDLGSTLISNQNSRLNKVYKTCMSEPQQMQKTSNRSNLDQVRVELETVRLYLCDSNENLTTIEFYGAVAVVFVGLGLTASGLYGWRKRKYY